MYAERRLLRPDLLPARVLRRLLHPVSRTVLFVCVENAARSLMAEAFFNADPPPGWHAVSAGTAPGAAPNPRTGPMLREVGLEPPAHPPQALTEQMMTEAQIRVTMGCLESASCPARLKERPLIDWELPDPARGSDAEFRAIRDDIRHRVENLRRSLGPS